MTKVNITYRDGEAAFYGDVISVTYRDRDGLLEIAYWGAYRGSDTAKEEKEALIPLSRIQRVSIF